MSTELDIAGCVSIERLPNGRRKLVLIDGDKIELSDNALDTLIRKERLHVIARSELRALSARHQQIVSWVSLSRTPKGYDDQDVALAKQVARYQEQFRNAGDGWAWWTRFTSMNSPTLSADIILMVNSLATQYRHQSSNGLPIDWLEMVRRVMAEESCTSSGALRASITRLLEEEEELDE